MTENTASIRVEDTGSARRYVATIDGHDEEAELELSRVNDALMIAAHTGVPQTMEGKGVGKALVVRLVEDAQAESFRIIPLCPFVKAMFKRHPEWNEVLKD